ncbi:peptidoglycan DD-metalloendopeptidase family protein [Nitrosomonas sp. Nm58]|uniref:peptidoglycan DD-metalloendopeptidase family protein n=1 Tax=Nitrosomonas sp. Nm58 TaxID=200126 RepID=UPI00089C1C22|nr:peptidoglycan DD-metalloendopeptidase family protein [Nitrosomonas sp. Nm58]SDZ07692.1 lipoprotein NlpD [Nitrosomonas sp. Nm58]
MLEIMIRKAGLEIYGVIIMAILIVRSKLFSILSGLLLFLPCILIIGCIAPYPAPVVESQRKLNQAIDKAASKQIYVVQRGDTLYGVALKHSIDYRELAQWNGIVDPNALRIGQEIDLSVPSRQKPSSQQEQVMPEQSTVAQPTLFPIPQPILPSEAKELPPSIPPSKVEGSANLLVTEPKSVKLPYSESAAAQLRNSTNIPTNTSVNAETVVMAPVTQKTIENESIPKNVPQKSESKNNKNIKWSWPANGQILSRYTEKSKGVSISGKSGQSVLASADGTVVYSGSGLRGYGKLIIVKHNDIYLSAYGHNSRILVREGEIVTRGQKIAEMGGGDSDAVKLHFEIRERGKPVDPLKFLSN